ncbi:hypothetical protein [Nonomuraea basaltis]|uniref:hypothetical protein n=1 Tax=Nonomuraea basaltis TaxID=2495887 RepID=UPI00110C55FE|nr:hypothetical protein [Nonomuraea basaltis]TMR96774.1 hypothetical protein EJK15_21615 [Nonomuraea basaltis]
MTIGSATMRKARDTRAFRRRALAVLLPLGPLCVAVLRVILPYSTTDDPAAQLAAVAAGQGAQDAVLWLIPIATLVLVPALFAMARMALRGAPVLAIAAITLALPGYLGMAALGASDAAALAAVTAGLSPSDGAALLEALAAQPALAASVGIFVLGHVLGTVLLGAALWRAHVIPAWAGLALVASQPLHLAFVISDAPKVLDGAAWGLTALGFAAAALTLARMSDDEYEPQG